ncbi:MAG: peptide deformylase [Armatimonadetes bacterium]|nr:peptide deformylase [Armatimonadota bacterium]
MAVRDIVVYPDSRLKAVCAPVTPGTSAARRLADDLRDTLDTVVGTGIAAPQIGELWRMIFVDPRRHAKYADSPLPPSVLLNPVIVERVGSRTFREGCLSLPEFTGQTRRAKRIVVEAFDLAGAPLRFEADGFEAVLLQHEIDHLDGVLFVDRVENRASLLRREERPT